jgi:hypothetical protein
MDFQAAAKAHRDWNIKLRMYIDGSGDLKHDDVAKDNACVLGQWIYGEGKQFQSLPEYSQLVKMHTEFHKNASKIVKFVDDHKKEEAKHELDVGSTFRDLSSKIVNLILTMEQKIKA